MEQVFVSIPNRCVQFEHIDGDVPTTAIGYFYRRVCIRSRKEERMISMSQIATIRQRHRQGEEVSKIAREVGVSRGTVYKY